MSPRSRAEYSPPAETGGAYGAIQNGIFLAIEGRIPGLDSTTWITVMSIAARSA
jgi:hypothetical protein